MSFRIMKKAEIDGQVCYNLWMKERISIYRIPMVLESRELVSLKTGEQYKPQSIWRSAWMYALEHLDELRNDKIAQCNESNVPFEEDEFNREIFAKAKQFYSGKKFRQFIINHPVFGKYYEKK